MRARTGLRWLLALPIMVVGSQCAHVLAYRLAYPNAHLRLGELLTTGHAYMSAYPAYLPLLLAAIGAIELVAIGWLAIGTISPSHRGPVPAWAFALLPLVGFTLQEVLERLLSTGRFPWWVVLAPTFRLGLLLQLPFALAAYVAARLLLRVADGLQGALATVAPKPIRGAATLWCVVPAGEAATPTTSLHSHPARAPPRILFAAGVV